MRSCFADLQVGRLHIMRWFTFSLYLLLLVLLICLYGLKEFLFNFPAKTKMQVRCDLLFRDNRPEIAKWRKISIYPNDSEILTDLDDCRNYKKERGYLERISSSSQYSMSIAYSILMHKDLYHLDYLLQMIYTSQNYYCIHVDSKSKGLIEKVQKLVRCFDNVFVTEKFETVYWGGFGVLKATLNCMEELLKKYKDWKYFINLSVQDFPLKTNSEIIQRLDVLSGANIVEILPETNQERLKYKYVTVFNKFGNPDSNRRTNELKAKPPSNITVFKGNLAAVINRQFAQWITDDQVVYSYLEWLKDTNIPDEHFWATLIANKIIWNNPKFMDNSQHYNVRYSIWKSSGRKCGGKFIRDVCIFGVSDLNGLATQGYMFGNKIYAGYQSATSWCMKWWMKNRR